MELIKRLKPDFLFEDDRGLLVQLVHDGYRQINAVFTKKGAVRGNFHYHKETDEAFFILAGRVKVTAALDGAEETAEFGAGEMFLIPRSVRHTFVYTEDTYLVGMYPVPVEKPDGSKDIHAG